MRDKLDLARIDTNNMRLDDLLDTIDKLVAALRAGYANCDCPCGDDSSTWPLMAEVFHAHGLTDTDRKGTDSGDSDESET